MNKLLLLLLLLLPILPIASFAQLAGPAKFINQTSQYTAEYQAVLDYAQTQKIAKPTVYQRRAQDNFVRALKNIGVFSITDNIKILATNGPGGFTDINIVSPGTNNSTRVSGPLLLRNRGYKYDGVTSITNTNFIANTAINYTLNSGSFAIAYGDIVQGVKIDGARDASNANQSVLSPLHGATQSNSAVNSSSSNIVTNAQFDALDGIYFVTRANSTQQTVRKGSASRVTSSVNSNARTAKSFYLGGFNDNGTLSTPHTRRVLLFWAGSALTSQQELDFKTAWDNYLAAIASEPLPPTLGIRYNKSSWTGTDLTNDFTNSGTTVSSVANKLQFTAGNSSLSATLGLNQFTCLEKWKFTAQFTVDKTSGPGGIGFGVKSVNTTTTNDVVMYFSSSSTVSSGVSTVSTGASGTYTNRVSTSALSYSSGDVIETIAERKGDTLRVFSRNVTTASATVTNSYTVGATSPLLPNTSRFAIYIIGHTTTLNSLLLESGELKNPPFVIVGDSKVCYYYASKYNTRTSAILGDFVGQGVALGGPSDKTAEMMLRTQEIIDLNPAVVILTGASNDPRFGVASGATNSNYATMVSALTGAGLRVLHTTGYYEAGGLDQSGLQTYIIANYSAANVIDTLPTVIGNNADNIHPNDAGVVTWVNLLINSGKLSIN